MIRDILVSLTQGTERDPAAAFAASLAAAFSAHLTGVAVTYEIDVPPFYMGAVPTDFIETQSQENEAAAKQAAARFAQLAAGAGIGYDLRTLSASLGVAANTFAQTARLFDLTVVAQPDPDRPGPEEVIAETVLLDSGRAVLLVPYVQTAPFTARRAVLAWDGSRAAARALAEGLPLLRNAAVVEVLQVIRGSEEAPGGDDVARHLLRHGIDARVRALHLGGSETSIAQTILNEVSDQDADLVVMGGYGHSRLRELVLGGVTREILGAMTVPVLMAH
ncbi:universal stress protein [Aquabacter spiritensis]|uniref:Universal stress protein family protein n=1 Tax=Aquabacter spiritensis TaxID=933073 RepID=A0A4R3LXH7_9HYPH|nr:universal stress protein [Aquabacter spiritensis]TCT03307.1 universal stress protein family protein [Aquabacter spiritensis]